MSMEGGFLSAQASKSDILILYSYPLYQYALEKLISEYTQLRVASLSIEIGVRLADASFDGLVMVCIDSNNLHQVEFLARLQTEGRVKRLLVLLFSYNPLTVPYVFRRAPCSLWTEQSSQEELLEAITTTMEGGLWFGAEQLNLLRELGLIESLSEVQRPEEIEDLPEHRVPTGTELAMLELMRLGYSNQQIAARLFLSLSTIKNRASLLFDKLGVTNRTSAVLNAMRLGLIGVSENGLPSKVKIVIPCPKCKELCTLYRLPQMLYALCPAHGRVKKVWIPNLKQSEGHCQASEGAVLAKGDREGLNKGAENIHHENCPRSLRLPPKQ